ncbi:uncharacterized protein L969DRAFT_48081, partial [Mixia osmundae IAM 14324]
DKACRGVRPKSVVAGADESRMALTRAAESLVSPHQNKDGLPACKQSWLSGNSHDDERREFQPTESVSMSKGKERQIDEDAERATRISGGTAARAEMSDYEPPAAELAKYLKTRPRQLKRDYKHSIRDRKLASHLSELSSQHYRSAAAAHEHDDLLLDRSASGLLEPENDLERTWRVRQREIQDSVGLSSASKAFDLQLDDLGPYVGEYTHDGRRLALCGRKGHVATFDTATYKLETEIQLKETCRDAKWLSDGFLAVAQRQYVYIYDQQGLEIHQLRNHMEVTHMEFLRYHYLLATIGNAGYLKWQDTSTGQIVTETRTRLGQPGAMTQDPATAVINVGHANGTVTLWTPNLPHAQVTLLAHAGPVKAISVMPSVSGSPYMATSGLDGKLKVWDCRTWSVLNEWQTRRPAGQVAWSQRGLLAAGWGNQLGVYRSATSSLKRDGAEKPGLYLTHATPGSATQSLRFCPFDDVLGLGHAKGFTSLIVPGAGEPHYDSLEADPFQGKTARRERQVQSLLDKIPADQITVDQDIIGKLLKPKELAATAAFDERRKAARATPFARLPRTERLKVSGKADIDDEDEDAESIDEEQRAQVKPEVNRRVKGRSKEMKRLLRRRKNVVDEQTLAIRAKLAKQREARLAGVNTQQSAVVSTGALSRFGNRKL